MPDRNRPAPRVLLDGIAFGESPRWHDGRLWFCDWAAEELIAVDPDGRDRADHERSLVPVLDRLAP